MKNILKFSYVSLLVMAGNAFSVAQTISEPGFSSSKPVEIQKRAEFVPLAEAFRGGIVGLMVTKADGTSVVEYNADTRLMPASNQKLYSVIYALDRLATNQTFSTQISVQKGKWLIQTPFSGTISLDQWKAMVKTAKTRSKFGNPKDVEVRQLFKVGIPDGWELDDLGNSYAAPIQSLSVNFGRVQLKVKDGFLETIPKEFGLKLISKPVSSESSQGFRYDYLNNSLVQTGLLRNPNGDFRVIAVPNPDATAAKMLATHITFTKLPGFTPLASGGTIVATYDSPNVGQLAALCLQPSDNQLAESLLILAAASEGPLGENPHSTATIRIKNWLQSIGIAADEARPQDGSGLSRHNLTSPRALIKLLSYARTKPWYDVLVNAMARPGVGTLRTRLSGTSFRGKTGTLDVVVGLSGYIKTAAGEEYNFSCLVNHASGSSAQVRNEVDNLVRTIENTGLVGNNVAYSN